MSKGVSVFVALALLAGCAPQHSRVPVGAQNWPESKRIQRLPPAQALPPPKPAWVARDVVPDATEVAEQTYIVQPGDTLRRISDRLGAASEAIARANNIAPPFIIKVGQRLRIPGGRYHRVKTGETGIAIARAYGVAWGRVIDANNLADPYILRNGQKLLLPTAREVAAMSLEDRARAFRIEIDDLITGSEPAGPEQVASTAPTSPSVSAPAKTPASPAPPASLSGTQTGAQIASFASDFSWPVKGRILSRFGPKPGGRFNDGINIKASAGDSVRAAADGVVAYAGNTIPGFGGLVLIKHDGNWVTAYAHAESLLVTRGQKVKKGDIIARAGDTGSVDEPQVHFEIREGRRPVDPLKHLPSLG